MSKVLGIDLGGTRLRIGMVDEAGGMHHHKVVPSSVLKENGDFVGDLIHFLGEYFEESGEKPEAMAFGIPSAIYKDEKTAFYSPNLKSPQGKVLLDHTNIADPVAEAFGVPVWVGKDTNYILVYDREVMGLQDADVIVAGYIGTGYGGAIMVNGEFVLGKNGIGEEIGHVPFWHGDALCGCGKRGCAEAYASGVVLKEIREQYFPETDISEMFTKHAKEQVLQEFVYAAALPFAMMGNLLAPDAYVAGGGVIEMKDFPREDFMRYIRENISRAVVENGLDIRFSEVNQEKGVLGSAMYARQKLEKLG